MVTAGTPLNVAPSNIVILLFSKLSMRKLFKPSNARSEIRCACVVSDKYVQQVCVCDVVYVWKINRHVVVPYITSEEMYTKSIDENI